MTLTYSDEHLPSDWGLHVGDWQRFAKRLRKDVGPFRFFMAAEYGERSLRPHFHALLFGVDFADDRMPLPGKGGYFLSPRLERIWAKGHTIVGDVTWQSAAYVARYCMKKVTGPISEFAYLREKGDRFWYVRPEFCTMSRRGGLGEEWFRRYGRDVYPSDESLTPDGKRIRTPRYYDKLLERSSGLEALEALKLSRKSRALMVRDQVTPERLAAREAIARFRNAQRSREVI